MSERLIRGLIAGAVGGAVGGLPSTLHALLTGYDPLAATRAAGTLLASPNASPRKLLPLGVVAHTLLSLGWGLVLERTLPRHRTAWWGAAGGLLIAALDLGLAGRRLPAIRALPQGPQVADHLLYGAVTGMVLERLRPPAA